MGSKASKWVPGTASKATGKGLAVETQCQVNLGVRPTHPDSTSQAHMPTLDHLGNGKESPWPAQATPSSGTSQASPHPQLLSRRDLPSETLLPQSSGSGTQDKLPQLPALVFLVFSASVRRLSPTTKVSSCNSPRGLCSHFASGQSGSPSFCSAVFSLVGSEALGLHAALVSH